MTTTPERFPFSDTPPGGIINTTTISVPSQLADGGFENAHLTYVLVRGGVEDVGVYVGIGTAKWVVWHGQKLRFKEAVCHFPNLREEWYRR